MKWIVSIVCIFLLFRIFVFQIIWIKGNSMLPYLTDNSIVLIYKIGFTQNIPFSNIPIIELKPKNIMPGDIVVLEHENDFLIKRILCVAGDLYEFKEDQVLWINDTKFSENYTLFPKTTESPGEEMGFLPKFPFRAIFPKGEVPEGYYLILGDNRLNSTDSRNLGLVHYTAFRGKLLSILKK